MSFRGRLWQELEAIDAQLAACELCGCTDEAACPGGCAWVPNDAGIDLCSACAAELTEAERDRLGAAYGVAIASPAPAPLRQRIVAFLSRSATIWRPPGGAARERNYSRRRS